MSERPVTPLLHDLAFFQHIHPVDVANRRQPVGNDYHSDMPLQFVDALLDRALGLGVQRAGGFVQNQQPRAAKQFAGDKQSLALAAGEPQAVLADQGVVAIGQGLYKGAMCAWRAASRIRC